MSRDASIARGYDRVMRVVLAMLLISTTLAGCDCDGGRFARSSRTLSRT